MKKTVKYIFISLFSVGLIGIDLITKILLEGKTIIIIKDFIILESVHNYGAGLGILSGQTTLLIIASIFFLIIFIVYDILNKKNSKVYILSISLIFAGAIGNLIDRIFLGYVRDFINIKVFFMPYIFNLADAFLTVGVVLFIIEILFKSERKKNDREIESK